MNIKVGNKIKFADDRLWFEVQAMNDRFIICTSKGAKYHTIINLEEGIRGDDNMVFHNGYDTKELCEQRLVEFSSGELELSHRNNVELKILTVK
jgi:hypothetical protein